MIHMIFFGVYIFVCLILFSIVILFYLQVKKTHIIEEKITTQFLRIFLSVIGLIALFGGYMILTGDIFPVRNTGNTEFIHL